MAGFAVAPYDRTSHPTEGELHVLNRLGSGYSRSSYRALRRAGGASEWVEQQLEPESIVENGTALEVDDWFPDLRRSPREIHEDNRSGRKSKGDYARDLAHVALLRRIYSRRSVFEQMVEFWSNHLHIDSRQDQAYPQRAAYDRLIRQHALGRFEDILVAATLHPAMLLALDTWRSVRNAPNENHGRELLELHTVGRSAPFTEAMVKDSAKILSGHTVLTSGASMWEGYYDPARHTMGRVKVLGFEAANGVADGRELTVSYLRYLANHPATAQRVARKLAVRFCSDEPSQALVDRVAKAYLDSGTDTKAMLRALLGSEEFWDSAGGKVRTPMDDLVATCRALKVKADAPTGPDAFARRLSGLPSSTLPYQWPSPDGPPDTAVVWAGPSRMLSSWRMHWALAGGYWPEKDVRYARPASWLPKERIRFDRFVDHLCRVLLGRPSTPRILEAACVGIDVAPDEVITASHAVIRWKFPRLCALLLDSPAHMAR